MAGTSEDQMNISETDAYEYLLKAGHPAPTRGHIIATLTHRRGYKKTTYGDSECVCAVCVFVRTGKVELQMDIWCSIVGHEYCRCPCLRCAESTR